MFTVISAVLKHDAKTLREILRNHILNHPIWKHFDVTTTSVWMDNASQHFRNYETFATFYELGQERNSSFDLNFFAEYHGKSECDRHFGLISRLYKESTRFHGSTEVTTTEEWMKMYTRGILACDGRIISEKGGFYDELHSVAEKHLNVVISEFRHPGQEEFLIQLERAGSSEQKKNPAMPLEYTRHQLAVEPMNKRGARVPFAMNLYYKFSFIQDTRGQWYISSKLDDKSRRTDFRFNVNKTQTISYSVPLGGITSRRRKYCCVAKVVRRRRYHEEDDYGQASTFLDEEID